MHPRSSASLRSIAPALLAAPFVLLCMARASAQTRPPAPASHACNVVHTVASEGDIALARKDYDASLAFFRAQLAKEPDSMEARLGLVRSLLGKDQVTEAKAALAGAPAGALTEVAAGEVAYRAAEFQAANEHAFAAVRSGPCEGRARALTARLYTLFGYNATAAKAVAAAHQLRPDDELIRREWIDSLPRGQRRAELERYLSDKPTLSAKEAGEYQTEQQYLRARRPGECHLSSRPASTKVPFQLVSWDALRPHAFGLDAAFNGKRRRLEIDTGASGIVLTASAAKALGLPHEYTIKTGGVGDQGDVDSYLTHVASIRIGDVEIADCMVEVLAKSNAGMSGLDGLIGMNVFWHWLVTLDYPNRMLLLNPLPPRDAGAPDETSDDEEGGGAPHDAITPPQMQNWLRVATIGHDLLIPSSINNGPTHYLIADTGASVTTLSLAFAKEAGKLHEEPDARIGGISGEVKTVYSVDNAVIQFGNLRLTPQSYLAFDFTQLSHEEGTDISGLFGFPTLSRLTVSIDYRDNLMQLKYDFKNDPQR
jgi:predicted aspartyl protease